MDFADRGTLAERHEKASYHLELVGQILLLSGDLCPRCWYGTRKTSKNWGRCKKCDERVPRRTDAEVVELLK